MSESAPTRHLNIKQAAAYWNVSEITIRRSIADGSLPARRIGKSIVRISLADLDALAKPVTSARSTA